MESQQPLLRRFLLQEVVRFVREACRLDGVLRIAIIGSLTTDKPNPKDADILITIDVNADIESLAAHGRHLKGRAQSKSSGADIFLCDVKGNYIGRTCSWKECRPRRACRGHQCGFGTRVCDDFEMVRLDNEVIQTPPLILWPKVERLSPVLVAAIQPFD